MYKQIAPRVLSLPLPFALELAARRTLAQCAAAGRSALLRLTVDVASELASWRTTNECATGRAIV